MFIWHSFHSCSFDWIQWDCIWWIFHVLQANRWKMLSIYQKKACCSLAFEFKEFVIENGTNIYSRVISISAGFFWIIKYVQTLWKQIGSSGCAWLDTRTTALFFRIHFTFFKVLLIGSDGIWYYKNNDDTSIENVNLNPLYRLFVCALTKLIISFKQINGVNKR